MKTIIQSMAAILLSVAVQASNNETCIYTAKDAQKMAEFQNELGWFHCNGKFVGMQYALYGINEADLEIMTAKANRVLAEGQKAATPQQYGAGAIFLYEFFQGKGLKQFVQGMTMQLISNYFGAANQFATMGVSAPPQWYTDPNSYDKVGSIANLLRNNTIAAMLLGMETFTAEVIKSFPLHCDGMNPDYDVALQNVYEFLDLKYEYCRDLTGQ